MSARPGRRTRRGGTAAARIVECGDVSGCVISGSVGVTCGHSDVGWRPDWGPREPRDRDRAERCLGAATDLQDARATDGPGKAQQGRQQQLGADVACGMVIDG